MRSAKILAIILYLLPGTICAQYEFEANYQTGFSSHLNAAVHSGNEGWIVGGQRELNDVDQKPGIVFSVDSLGYVKWSHFVMQDTIPMGVSEVLDVAMVGDSALAIAGRARISCDNPPDLGFIQLLDTAGSLIWSEFYATGPIERIASTDSNLVASYANNIMGVSFNGDSLWSVNHGLGAILRINHGSETELMIACQNGLMVCDQNGVLIASRTTQTPVWEFERLDSLSTVHIIGNRAVLSSVQDLTPSDSIDLQPHMSQVKHLEVQYGGFWCVGDSISVLYDPGLNLSSIWPVDVVDQEQVRDVTASMHKLLFTGVQSSFMNTTSLIKSYSSHGDHEVNAQDVGVSNIIVDDLTYTLTPDPDKILVDMDLRIVVRNYGLATNQFLRLNSILGDGDCTPEAIWDQVGGLAMNPGDTAVAFKSVQMLVDNNGANTQFFLCFWSTTPNGKKDRNFTNDEFCKSITVPVGVGIQENIADNIKLWPQPTSDQLWISGLSDKAHFWISDLSGRTIEVNSTHIGSNFQLDVNDLPAGAFLLFFQEQQKLGSKLFLVE